MGDVEGGIGGLGRGGKDMEMELKKQREDLDRGLLDRMDGDDEHGDGEDVERVRDWFNIFRKWFTDVCLLVPTKFRVEQS